MSDNIFVDSNIFIYAHTNLDSQKQIKAQQLLTAEKIFISTQVVNEFINACNKKFKKEWKEINRVGLEIISYSNLQTISAAIIEKAIEVAARYKYSYYDSLIIASALDCECDILYSQDLQHQQKINKTLVIINPFKQ